MLSLSGRPLVVGNVCVRLGAKLDLHVVFAGQVGLGAERHGHGRVARQRRLVHARDEQLGQLIARRREVARAR